MTHTLLDSRHGASRAREILGNIALTQVSSSQLHSPFAFPSPWSRRPLVCADSGLLSVRGNRSLHAPTRANIPTSSYGSRRLRAKWNTRNWRKEASISRSDTPQHRPRRKLLGKRLSPHDRSGRKRAASRNQTNWFAAIAGAMTWLRVHQAAGSPMPGVFY